MSTLITLYLMGLIAIAQAKPGKPKGNHDLNTDTIVNQLVEELMTLRQEVTSMSANMASMTDKIASMSDQMTSMSLEHQTELETLSLQLDKAQSQIALFEVQGQPKTVRKTAPDVKPGNDERLPLGDSADIDKKDNMQQAYISQRKEVASTGVVAFYARIASFTGSSSENTPIPFDEVYLNLGGAYDSSGGQFTAPVAGIYSLSYEALSRSTCGTNNMCVSLYVSDIEVSRSCSEVYASGGATVNVQLAAGETAWVSVIDNALCYDLDVASVANKFSGHLVYQLI